MKTAPICYVDCETTGLSLDFHEIWEVGLILPDAGYRPERRWLLPVDLSRADPFALDIGRFHDRHPQGHRYGTIDNVGPRAVWDIGLVNDLGRFARDFARQTHGLHMVGAVPSFDDYRLAKLLRDNGAVPRWHYHTIDVEALAAGWLAGRKAETDDNGGNGTGTARVLNAEGRLVEVGPEPPWDSDLLSLAVGVDPAMFDRHTAIGDCRWSKAIYEAVTG